MKDRRIPAPVLDAVVVVVSLLDIWVHEESDEPLRRAAALLATAALVLRRHTPLPAFLLTLPAALVSDAIFAPLAALYSLASLNRRRVLLAVGALALTACDLTYWTWPGPEFADFSDSSDLVIVTYSLATATAPVFLGQLVQARRELSLRLAEISQAREHERALLAQSVLAKERAQLAREMHDVVSHQVSLIAVRAGALQVATHDAAAREAATTIRRLSVQTLEELRHMVSVLRAAGSRPTELTPQPSLADLQHLVDTSGIETQLHTDLPAALPPPHQRAVYRAVQEALTNVRKHAPGATAVIRIRQEDDTVHAAVTNSAPTRPALLLPGAHHGLAGLRQRAELLGGTVTAAPTADGGHELHLRLPLRRTP
ncbi:signal transduction histidine kinase [Streptomyces sp. V3I8]|uniref:sensor histidine kinase n=1 Tax=Streptomyces sp. V3I8 TaxID=3042279 RepID=UPI002782F3F1|nr:histidine kinase [Streptomyces sp. V3I8]MDQ1040607.1 signal transduction histidine kinase [Streptomyces sp. V3I8]